MEEKFKKILDKNKRDSAFSKVLDENKEIDPCLLDAVEEMYNTCIKPTVRKNYKKLIDKE